ncbi:hypothetical protein VM1G_08045 [Cytospora mali]|uniref:C2H2-type domain-containing protein n=1 Tax=Cytospora mali TaxID=578113 RepID=A0A194W7N9_CYTMA|nr:hypothetical protein VM1G_08045 [Valsa mali]
MPREGQVIAIIRGLKVRIPVLDRFFAANGVEETYGIVPVYHIDPDEHSQLLRSKVGGSDSRTRIFIPHKTTYNESNFAYVAYAWDLVHAQKEIVLDGLPTDPPAGWASLTEGIMSFSTGEDDDQWKEAGHGKMGLFIVVSENRHILPPSVKKRNTRPVLCDLCTATFDVFRDRQRHRMDEHGCTEGLNPLPDNE